MEANNMAELREALEYASRVLAKWRQDAPFSAWNEYGEAIDRCRASLAAPARNCDVMSLAVARRVWYAKEIIPRLNGDLPLGEEIPFEEWLFNPATEQEGETDGSK